jgi:hypothetical protein
LVNVADSFFFGCIRLRSAFLVDGLHLSELFFGVEVQLLENPVFLGIETTDGGISEDLDLLVKSFIFGILVVDLFLCGFFFSGISVIIGGSINISVLEVFVNLVFELC